MAGSIDPMKLPLVWLMDPLMDQILSTLFPPRIINHRWTKLSLSSPTEMEIGLEANSEKWRAS